MLALGLSRGRELGAILYTNELKSLSIDDIAEYLMKRKSPTLEQKYPDGTLSLSEFAFEMAITETEAKAVLGTYYREEPSLIFLQNILDDFSGFVNRLMSKTHLRKLYWKYNLTVDEIANITGWSRNRVIYRIDRLNISKQVERVA